MKRKSIFLYCSVICKISILEVQQVISAVRLLLFYLSYKSVIVRTNAECKFSHFIFEHYCSITSFTFCYYRSLLRKNETNRQNEIEINLVYLPHIGLQSMTANYRLKKYFHEISCNYYMFIMNFLKLRLVLIYLRQLFKINSNTSIC